MTPTISNSVSSASKFIPAFRGTSAVENEQRREMGRRHMSATMIFWLAQCGWSHPAFEAMAAWALDEDGALHTSQVSHIRNGRMRMLGMKSLDAFGAVNLAVWAYHHDKPLLKDLGCGVIDAKIEGYLQDAIAILDPETKMPLDVGGWMNLYLGYIQIPEVVGGAQGDESFEGIASSFGNYIAKSIAGSGKTPIEAKEIFFKSFDDEARATKLVMVGSGLDTYNTTELQRDFPAICAALSKLDGRARSPHDLIVELKS